MVSTIYLSLGYLSVRCDCFQSSENVTQLCPSRSYSSMLQNFTDFSSYKVNTKVLGVISVDVDIVDKLLIRYFAFVGCWRNNGSA